MGLVSDRINQFNKLYAINKDLSWLEVGSMRVGGNLVKTAFLDAKMVLLPARTKLYKFNSYPSLRPDANGNVTGWWSAYNAYDVDPGWHAKVAMAKHFKVSIRELGRVTSAITESWNSCQYCVTITLNVDMYVAYGRFKHQLRHAPSSQSKIISTAPAGHIGAFRPEKKAHTINLPGGGRQFFVPNLKPQYYGNQVGLESLLGR
ncbi:MAG: hypothetical protein SRB2_01623 [Desulfobacteraceae bacterium Eth-SRB2]|nr:MAG: hypothetical protein SRB2_01623 [Desulfobacteraceae bacterium Eth-SRB2]